MKIHFQAEELDLYGEGENIFLAIGDLEEKLKKHTGLESVLVNDSCIDWEEVLFELNNDTFVEKQYQRLDFSSPEDNFVIKMVDNP